MDRYVKLIWDIVDVIDVAIDIELNNAIGNRRYEAIAERSVDFAAVSWCRLPCIKCDHLIMTNQL